LPWDFVLALVVSTRAAAAAAPTFRADLVGPLIPDAQTFLIRLKACKTGQEAKRIYQILNQIKKVNGYPLDLSLSLPFAKEVCTTSPVYL